MHTSAVGQKELLVQAVSIDDKETLVTSLTGPAWAQDPTCSTTDQTEPLGPWEPGLLHHGPLGTTRTRRSTPKAQAGWANVTRGLWGSTRTREHLSVPYLLLPGTAACLQISALQSNSKSVRMRAVPYTPTALNTEPRASRRPRNLPTMT